MTIYKCPTCGEYEFFRLSHTCKPEYKAYRPEYQDEDEAVSVYASDLDLAADKACHQNFDRWDYPSNFELVIIDPEGNKHHYDVGVETVPEFVLSEKKEECK